MSVSDEKSMPDEKDWHELTEEDILKANREKYEDDHIVSFYDEEIPGQAYEYLEHEVCFRVLADHFKQTGKTAWSAIDVCGGAGKAAFMLHQCGCSDIVLLDAAPKMLEIAQRKINSEQIKGIDVILDDAIAYLKNTERVFDVIIFSSAIHHFKDPSGLLLLAFERLSPDGVVITLGDPSRLISSRRYQRAVSSYLFLTSGDHRKHVIRTLPARLKGTYEAPDYRDPAEYQAHKGIDDFKLKQHLHEQGIRALVHFRYPAGGSQLLTRLMPYIGLTWALGMVCTREDRPALASRLKQALAAQLPYKIKFYE